jgi:nucleoside-diphosphate-sugar epimerase
LEGGGVKRILIAGGCGYIGSALFNHLNFFSERDYRVDTVDLEWFGNYCNPNNVKKDFRKLTELSHVYDVVILLAGHSSVPMCRNDRLSSFRNNVVNFVELLDKLERCEDTKFIYASSSSIYGNTHDIAAPEDWERYDPKTYYDLQKQELDYYARLSDVEYYGLRFGTVNGWSPNLRVDIMLNKMYQCATKDNQISIFNKHIYRPILGIQDLVRAVEAIILGDDHRGIYNLASFNASVEEISNSINRVLGGDVEIVDKGISETYNFSINTNKFKETYGFEFRESVDSIVKSLQRESDGEGVREEHAYV